jgi:hypothetical protein
MEMAASSGLFFAMLTGGTLMVISKLCSDGGEVASGGEPL